jgi:hypothetical protein
MDNIRMDLGEVGWGDVDWIGLAQDRNRWRAHFNPILRFIFEAKQVVSRRKDMLFDPEDGGNILNRNDGKCLSYCITSHPGGHIVYSHRLQKLIHKNSPFLF